MGREFTISVGELALMRGTVEWQRLFYQRLPLSPLGEPCGFLYAAGSASWYANNTVLPGYTVAGVVAVRLHEKDAPLVVNLDAYAIITTTQPLILSVKRVAPPYPRMATIPIDLLPDDWVLP